MKLEFYPNSPGLTLVWVKPHKKPPSVPLMTVSRKAYLKKLKKVSSWSLDGFRVFKATGKMTV